MKINIDDISPKADKDISNTLKYPDPKLLKKIKSKIE